MTADVLFYDDFDFENGGNGALNYSNFVHWNVTSGSVDLIGNGFWDVPPGQGLYIDTQGTAVLGGTMVTKQAFSFAPGKSYVLSFDLAGTGWTSGSLNSEIVTVGSFFNQTISLLSEMPFQTFSYSFTVLAPESSPLSFAAGEHGWIGLKLDNVRLSAETTSVPDGGRTLWLAFASALAVAIGRQVRALRVGAGEVGF